MMPDEVLLQVLFCFCVVFVTSNAGPKRKGKDRGWSKSRSHQRGKSMEGMPLNVLAMKRIFEEVISIPDADLTHVGTVPQTLHSDMKYIDIQFLMILMSSSKFPSFPLTLDAVRPGLTYLRQV